MLPNESLLDVLHFADYNTLVAAQCAASTFMRVIAMYAAELPSRHNFLVSFFTYYVSYRDMTTGTRHKSIRFEPGNQQSLAAACRKVAEVIGAHSAANVIFSDNTWNMPEVDVIFEAAPALKFAEDVGLHSRKGSSVGTNSEAFLCNFGGMKTLRLLLDFDAFRQFSWAFLRHECARELRLIKGRIPDVSALREDKQLNCCLEELVRYCVTLRRLLGGEPLELDFSENRSSPTFALSVIELLRNTESKLIFRMRTPQHGEPGGELILDESDYTVDVDKGSTRYTSMKSGIVVEVKDFRTIIQSTAKVRPGKPSQALPTMPFLEH